MIMQVKASKYSERKVFYGRVLFSVIALVCLVETLISDPLFSATFWRGMFTTLMCVAIALEVELLFMPVNFKTILSSDDGLKYQKIANRVTAAAFICLAISVFITAPF